MAISPSKSNCRQYRQWQIRKSKSVQFKIWWNQIPIKLQFWLKSDFDLIGVFLITIDQFWPISTYIMIQDIDFVATRQWLDDKVDSLIHFQLEFWYMKSSLIQTSMLIFITVYINLNVIYINLNVIYISLNVIYINLNMIYTKVIL